MGVAGTAPAFSVAATTSTLVAAVGALSPASILYCGIIMFGITFAFMHLNRVSVNAGASYTWVAETFHPLLGFFAGWALLVASAVFMVSGTVPAATATLQLVAPAHANDTTWVSGVAAFWLIAVSAVIVKGIKPTSFTQIVMTGIELIALVGVIVLGIGAYASHPTHAFHWDWFSPLAFTPTTFATGAITALFFFWGWDVCVNLNEETRDAEKAAGRAAIWSMVIVMLLFVSFVVAALFVLDDQAIADANTNILFVMAEKLLPRPISYLAIIGVMLSTIGTLETSILQFSRTLYAKGRDSVLHPRFALLHPTWQTPWVATLTIALIGLILLGLSSQIPTVNEIIKDSVNAIGFQVCFYYSLAAFACVWRFRNEARSSARNLLLYVIWPGLSGLFLVFIGVYIVPTFDTPTTVIAIGGIAIGIVPWGLNRLRARRVAPA